MIPQSPAEKVASLKRSPMYLPLCTAIGFYLWLDGHEEAARAWIPPSGFVPHLRANLPHA